MKNNEINIDICRTIVSKPVLMSGSWNRRQYIGKESLKGSFMQVYNKYGWFGGYGNLDMTSDVGNMFVDDVLGEVRKQCLRF